MYVCVISYVSYIWHSTRSRSEQSLVRWATPQLHDIDALSKMVDPALKGLYPVKSLSRFADVIALCVQVELVGFIVVHFLWMIMQFWYPIFTIFVTAGAWVPATYVRSGSSIGPAGAASEYEQENHWKWTRCIWADWQPRHTLRRRGMLVLFLFFLTIKALNQTKVM